VERGIGIMSPDLPKTENLRGAVRETEPDAMPRLDLRIQFTTLKSMLANSRETIGKRGGGGSR
jgi:hypothetical protein